MKKLKVGLIGSGLMGKAHSVGYSILPIYFYPTPAVLVKEVVADVTEELAKSAAEKFGFNRWTANWENILADDDIDIVDIVTPNEFHNPIAIAAIKAGKHVLCEKPLARNGKEAKEMYDIAKKSVVKHMVGFNYRKVPAVAFAKQLIEEGKIGEIYHFRGFYLNDWAMDPNTPLSWRFKADKAGSGVIGDQGTHVMDMARYLIGDFTKVMAQKKTFIEERPISVSAFDVLGRPVKPSEIKKEKVDVDDMCDLLIEFDSGVKGTIEASRFARGNSNHLSFEINGSKGSLYFDWQRNNELQYYSAEEPFTTQGYRLLRMGPAHPHGEAFWPIAGFNIGYAESVAIEILDLITAIIEDKEVLPNFYDGWRICEITDAALRSVENEKWENCQKTE